MYLHERQNWWDFRFSIEDVAFLFSDVKKKQGVLLGHMESLGFTRHNEILLDNITLEIQKTSEIEGVLYNPDKIRSSVARKFNIQNNMEIFSSDRDIDGIVEMASDAFTHYLEPLTEERLFGWHASLFPTGRSGMFRISTGKYRTGPMQVISGSMGKETVHYVAPSPERINMEMRQLLDWLNAKSVTDPIIKAAVAHFWFVAIHPFDDGNGRIARAISDMFLARSAQTPYRFFSISAAVLEDRKGYYDVLERTQKGDGDITEWIVWFLKCLNTALENSLKVLRNIASKAVFWQNNINIAFNARQKKMLSLLLDNFKGNLTSSKWAKLCKCSTDTAQRDISDLLEKDILIKAPQGGRSTNYLLKERVL